MTQSNEMPEIKPCPCCRNKAELRTKHPDYFGAGDYTKPKFRIKCSVCPLTTGWLLNEEKLIIGWNTRAALQTPASDGWMPIDSAPKDGTEILVCTTFDDGRINTVTNTAWYDDLERPAFWDGIDDFMREEKITHWMPLKQSTAKD